MTGEETKQLKEKFFNESHLCFPEGRELWNVRNNKQTTPEDVWQFIESEIITTYEKQLEQVREEGEIEDFFKAIEYISNLEERQVVKDVWLSLSVQRSKSQNTQTSTEQVEREKVTITDEECLGKDEAYCNWYKCPHCKDTNLFTNQSFCGRCGIKLAWKLSQNTQTK